MRPLPSDSPGIIVEELRKRYGVQAALRGISLQVRSGEVHGLIGPDGAGKTTLMRILCGLLVPDGGQARVLGFDASHEAFRVKEHLGYMPQRFSLYPDLSVSENMRFFADLYDVPTGERQSREKRLLDFSGLGPFRKRRAGALSGGMKQKLALSCMLIHTPRVLILDEPTTGVDVVSRREFWEILSGLAREGLTLLVSTPYMDEAERFDRLALMHEGVVLAEGSPAQIRRRFDGRLLAVSGTDLLPAWHAIRERALNGIHVHRFGDRLHLMMASSTSPAVLGPILKPLRVETREISPSIEDTFVALVSGADSAGRGGRISSGSSPP